MAIVLINPNSTQSMTDAMLAAAQAAVPELKFEGWTSVDGPPAIQGPEDGAAATWPLLDLVKQASGAEGIIIGCFDDTALVEAARLVSIPVVGIGQAAFHFSALNQWRFGSVTTLPVSVPVIEGNIARYGLDHFSTGVRASDVPVLALDEDPDQASGPILAQAQAAVRSDGADAIVLGCAGMVTVADRLRASLPVPVIDPVEAAARSMRWLAV